MDVRLVGSEVALKQGEARLRILAGAYVLAPVGASLEKAVVCHLAQQGLKAATAESCTGGLIAKRITDVPGASGVFECGDAGRAGGGPEALRGCERARG